MYVAENGDTHTLCSLVKHGANVNDRDELGSTPLDKVCFFADARTVQLLLDHGADPNIRGYASVTPLLAAVNGENAAVVRLLVEHGAQRNIATPWTGSNAALQKSIDTLLRQARK
jgi:ankyrin repeat protein